MKCSKIREALSTRSFRAGDYSAAATAMVLAIAVMVNVFASALPADLTQFDTTSNQLFTLSEQTEALLGSLHEEVTIYWIVRSGCEEGYLETLLDRYRAFSGNVRVIKKDPDVYPTFTETYVSDFTENSLIVECGDRFKYVDYNDIFVLDYASYYDYGTQDWSFHGESVMTSAIDYVTNSHIPKVYLLTGHGEASLPDSYAAAVEDESIETEQLSLLTLEGVPEDADCVLINVPQTDISEDERAKLQNYLSNGGNVFLITDPPQNGKLSNLEGMMEGWGVTAEEGIVVEGDQNSYIWGTAYYLLPELNAHAITDPLISGGCYVLLPIAQGLTVSQELRETLTVTELLTTSNSAFSKLAGYDLSTYEKEAGDLDGPFALGVVVSDAVEDGITSDIVWVSSGALVDESSSNQVSGGNLELFLNALSYLCEAEESSLTIRAKSLTTEYLSLDSGTEFLLKIVMLGLIPAVYLGVGVLVWAKRKRR